MNKKTLALICAALMALSTVFVTACASDNTHMEPSPQRALLPSSSENEILDYAPLVAPIPTPRPNVLDAVADLFGSSASTADSSWEMADEFEAEYFSFDGGGGAHGGLNASAETTGSALTPVSESSTEGLLAEKIIYTVHASIETKRFDETIAQVHSLMANHNAFIEHSNISGVNYASQLQGRSEVRYASFTLRVPVKELNAMTLSLDGLGNVVEETSRADNITSQFFDVQSRLNSLTVQEERLLEMLSQTERIADMLTIEGHLSEVRYEIELLTTTINNWQRQVDYSTLSLWIVEVEQFTEKVESDQTYWQQIGDGFMSTLRGVGSAFMSIFMWLIVSAPVLVILAIIGVVTFILIKRKTRSLKKKKAIIQPNTAAAHAHVYKPPENNFGNNPPGNNG